MNIFTLILAALGLALFEAISSIDNALINAEVLSTMRVKSRRWFLLWGFLFAVVVVRGLLPWLIVWIAAPSLGPVHAFTASFSGDPAVHAAIVQAQPLLFSAGGIFLVFLFFNWLFLEEKNFGLPGERFIQRQGGWFFATVSIILAVIVYLAQQRSAGMAFAAVLGSTVFFITHGFKQNAERNEQSLKNGKISDLKKILYLEVIDTAFSIDSVLGAFAFTLSIPVILIGNSLGAFLVRKLTLGNIERIKKYRYLNNGAMYSVLFLGLFMLLNAFGFDIPEWVSPICTFFIIGYFFWKSKRAPTV